MNKQIQDICEHEFSFLETLQSEESRGWVITFEKEDIFCCNKCLKFKKNITSEDIPTGKGVPVWWQPV